MIKLYTDGASKGNPGPAAAGAWAEDAVGNKIFEISQQLGSLTNNEAEYSALILGLEQLAQNNYHHIPLTVYTDSQLMARQLRGEYKLKSPTLRTYHDQAQVLLKQWSLFKIVDIRRQLNSHADYLANLAFKSQANS